MKYLVSLFVTAFLDYIKENPKQADELGDWLVDKFIGKLPQAVDKLTDAIPGQLDDKIFDTLAARFAKALQKAIPGFDLIFKFLK
ncbi:hypothetical protein P5V64_21255 [Mycobacteroides abscessus subsp. abscessus]|uniref:hypothetical protein n=1 Tax=Mycobacteroides abscessus TaxID=36809 RepID=UPI00266BBBFB|nr:hypothetical protein [Mycobacteroides abscessus]MDO3120197.1 hypothetical protein [Mycobacteroides abscessus subsp. abscessus]MDO3324826.1 hypothetical protein [Mycobacteroides abscessus subsp. abscessus]